MSQTMPRQNAYKAKRQGFVLLFTLVTIALASFVLAKLANHRLELAAVTNDKVEDLQLRWGNLTLRRSISYTKTNPQEFGKAFAVPLGDLTFKVLIDSESRKLNLNTVLIRTGRENLFAMANSVMPEGGNYLYLAPSGTSASSFVSWGDVFQLEHLPNGADSGVWLMEQSENVTCWGNGRLHYLDTPDAIFETLMPTLGFEAVTKFLDLRRLKPNLELSAMIEALELEPDEKLQLESWLTEKSDTVSIWMFAESNTTKRKLQTEFVVAQRSTNGSIELKTFDW